jgi:hypothetical protein
MPKKIQLLILPALLSTFIYAIDLNNTDEILKSAEEAIQTMQVEMNQVVSSPITEIIASIPIIIEELHTTSPTLPPIDEGNITILTDEHSHILTASIPIEKDSLITEESNHSIKEENTTPEPINEEKGDLTAGKNIFKYLLKADCHMNGHKFSNKYSQEEWEEIAELNKFKETLFEECPNARLYYQERWTVDLYKFFHEMSNDEEGIPEC